MSDKKGLYIFDFDNTLVTTDCRVIVKRWKQEYFLSPAQYSEYDKGNHDVLDMSQFKILINPEVILKVFNLFKNTVKNDKIEVMILTARSQEAWPDIKRFLKGRNIDTSKVEFIGLDSSDPYLKADVIQNKVRNNSFSKLFFYDDCSRVRSAAIEVLSKEHMRYKVINPLEM